jgi:transglutaminase-like putative cysteine protease
MPNKFNVLILFALLISNTSTAVCQTADSTVKITSTKSSYTFLNNKESKTIQVKELSQTQYHNALPTTLPLTEFYSENSKINAFTCKVNNKGVKDFKPIDTYYSTEDIFHSDLRVCYFPLKTPANSIIDVLVDKTILNPLYFTSIYFSSEYPTAKNEITLKIPRWMNVSFKEMNFEGYTIKKEIRYLENEDADVITYQALNLPRMENEHNSPGHSYIYPHLLVLSDPAKKSNTPVYFNSVQDQYNWYAKLVGDLNDEKDPAIIQQVAEITRAKTTDIDKIKAVFYWVQENIRYIAFEDGLAGFKPDKASEVLRKKYGDCKGMANLTKTLLKTLGFDARLCWLGTNHIAYNYDTPSLSVDNHMICALNYKDQTYFLDATETYLGFNEYAERIQGRQALIEDGKNYFLKHIPSTGKTTNLNTQKQTLSIKDKNLIGSVKQLWKGEEKEMLLSRINASRKEKQDRDLITFLSNDNPNYEINDLNFSDLKNYDQDLTANFNVNFKNGADLFEKVYYLSLDFDKEYNNSIIDTLRKNDYLLAYKSNIQKEVELQIPDNYILSGKPDNVVIKNENYQFTITYEVKQDKVIYKKNLQILNPKIKKANFSSWNNSIKTLSQNYKETITLTPKS